jgi:hypothetical protein
MSGYITPHEPDRVLSKVAMLGLQVNEKDIRRIQRIGRGATGLVFLAKYKNKKVAAKMLKSEDDTGPDCNFISI